VKRILLFLPLIAAVVLGVVLFAGIGKDPTRLDSALIGKPVPAFSLPDLQNPEQVLDQRLFEGQVTLLNVWATWCPSCRQEHPFLMWLSKTQGVRIVGLDYKDTRSDALQWFKDLGNPYEVTIFDAEGKLGFDLGVYGAPETFVIDSDGVVRYRHVGVVDEKVWKEELSPLIEKLRSGTS
jgi:cytochrome c biogenesis protein CcmG/thiol:disulfide interchange protein DsbE